MLKRLAGPMRKYFNARFSAIHQSVVQGNIDDHALLAAVADKVNGIANDARETGTAVHELLTAADETDEGLYQTLGLISRSIDDLGHKLDLIIDQGIGTHDDSADVAQRVNALARRLGLDGFDVAQQGSLSQLGEYEAAVANYTHAHDGWAAQAGLWFNPPLSVAHAAGGVSLSDVNERIAEVPFAFRQLAGIPAGSRVLDIGSTESTVAVSLATLGYHVTAIDPRPYPLSHPQLTTFQGPIADYTDDHPFDAVVLLSSIEHFGVGAYGLTDEDDADLAAMARVRRLSRPGTRLVLTTPFGNAPTTALERTYDPDRLAMLLQGWQVDEQSYLTRESQTQWRWHPEVESLDGDHVVLVSATRLAEAG